MNHFFRHKLKHWHPQPFQSLKQFQQSQVTLMLHLIKKEMQINMQELKIMKNEKIEKNFKI